MRYKMLALFIGAALLCTGCDWHWRSHEHQDEHGEHEGHDHASEAPFHREADNHDHDLHDDHDEHDELEEARKHNDADGHDHEGEEALHAGEIHFTHEQAHAVDLKVERIDPAAFRAVIHTGGMIQSSQGSEQAVAATSSGLMFFANSFLTEGAAVKAGDPLVNISSDKLQEGDIVLKAKIEFETAGQEYERAKKLVDDKIISQKEFNEIRARYQTAKATFQGMADNLSSTGLAVTSPISGYIKKWMVQNGQYVSLGEPVAIVAQDKRLQLHADVTENNFKYLRNVHSANFKTAYDDEVYQLANLNGKLLSYGKSAEEGSAYIPVTFEFDNIGDIVPGSFAEVYLLANKRENVLTVPLSALVEEQGQYFVFVQLEDEIFRKNHVTLGQSDGTRVEIVKGIHAGDKVVTNGAYSVKLATASTAIPGHTH
ncbi:MAG: efflux RND transporter periplasmic adaptor subunit [Bacteroides sp.]|nr:efflux RND transporter periplasmic adaptor subunit [Bacteroides sp.]MCM1085334.1 efflux RND transporter periplasmic adaptor subunit [Bacteroides sp.]MCM1169714.1 efflux RND transporter periplasmic adaptor subunit [Bacteroides sp.]